MYTLKTLVLAAPFLAGLARASYSLVDSFDKSNFFSEFNFFSGADPTNGFVTYLDASAANNRGLAGYSQGGVYMGVDYKNNSASVGRASVRVSSKKSYTTGVFVADIAHMPSSSKSGCGVWPAWWTFGPNWPNNGEIDVLEGVNSVTYNQMTLHTSDGCTIANKGSSSSTKLVADTCAGNSGCGQTTPAGGNLYGTSFNSAGGGVYVMEWTDSAISIWFFSRSDAKTAKVTTDLIGSTIDTSALGTPVAKFVPASCDFTSHFKNHNIIFDTTFCGDWAGASSVWSGDATCAALGSTCRAYVGANAQDFEDAYWLVNSVKVFQSGGRGSGNSTKKARDFEA